MSTLIANTLQGINTIKADANTTAMTIDSSGRTITHNRLHVLADISQTAGTNQYVSLSTGDALPFGTVVDGDASLLNTSTYKFQAPVAGLYNLSYVNHSNSSNAWQNSFQRERSGTSSQLGIHWWPSNLNGTSGASMIIECEAGDQCWVRCDNGQTSYNGGGAVLSSGNRYTWATWSKIG